jgi:hypothetical protein
LVALLAATAAPAATAEVIWLSGRPVYPPYLADWKNPEFSLAYVAVTSGRVPDSGDSRVEFKLGTRFTFASWSPRGAPDRPWQLEGEAGGIGITDRDHHLDLIGWDGTYALLLAREVRPTWFAQLGTKHISSHVGDEYAERTGRRRIGYTREEVTLGLTRRSREGLAAYVETGVNYNLRDGADQDRWRVQAGVQKEWTPPVGDRRHGFFAAANLEMLQELDWQPDYEIQGGLQVRSGERRWRLGVHYRDGRTPLGEFTGFRETYFVFGAWLVL